METLKFQVKLKGFLWIMYHGSLSQNWPEYNSESENCVNSPFIWLMTVVETKAPL